MGIFTWRNLPLIFGAVLATAWVVVLTVAYGWGWWGWWYGR